MFKFGACLIESGRLFQRRGAAHEKARLPNRMRWKGLRMRRFLSPERRSRPGHSRKWEFNFLMFKLSKKITKNLRKNLRKPFDNLIRFAQFAICYTYTCSSWIQIFFFIYSILQGGFSLFHQYEVTISKTFLISFSKAFGHFFKGVVNKILIQLSLTFFIFY